MQNIDTDLLRERVNKRMDGQSKIVNWVFFATNILLFVIFVLVSSSLLNGTPGVNSLSPDVGEAVGTALMFGYLGWIMSIFFQGLGLLLSNPRVARMTRQQVAAQELGKMAVEAMDGDALEKPKRRSVYDSAVEMELSDDGELIPTDESRDEPQTRRAAQ